MKNFAKIFAILLLSVIITFSANAQKQSLSVLNMDSQGISMTAKQLGSLLRMEIEKIDQYEVMDRYDVEFMIKKHNLDIEGCYGKICLVEMGKLISSDKMLSGTVEVYGKKLIVTTRLIDVKKEIIEKAHVREYLDLPNEIQTMIGFTLREMLGFEVDQAILMQITEKEQYENMIINPNETKLNLGGPRIGITYFTGEVGKRLMQPTNEGGYDAFMPAMFMFGYQVEVQYLNSGNFQSLFEFVPSITGVDQGLILPNLSAMIGFRHNVKGWEIALGPNVGLIQKAKGYYDGEGTWYLSNEWVSADLNPHSIISRADSRGDIALTTGFVIAAGKSFKSGRMNFPVNAYVIPSKEGIRAGVAFGFNAKN